MADCIPIQHRVLTLGDIHGIANWQFATEQALQDFLGPFVVSDLHKVSYVQETGQYYVLSSISPITWTNFSVPVVTAIAYNSANRRLELALSDGTTFETSFEDIYTYADGVAAALATAARNAAIAAANDYTDIAVANFSAELSAINSTIAALAEAISPIPKEINGNYTLQEEDNGRLLVVDSSSDVTISVGSDPEDELEVGFKVSVDRRGTGRVIFAVPAADTIEFAGTSPEIEVQFAGATFIHKVHDDVAETSAWGLYGRLPQ